MNMDASLHDRFVELGIEVAVQVVARKSVNDPQMYRALAYARRYPGQHNIIAEPICVGDEATTETEAARLVVAKYEAVPKAMDSNQAAQATIASLQAEIERLKTEPVKSTEKPVKATK